jgi:putative hemolysin
VKVLLMLSICLGLMLIVSGCTQPANIPETPSPSVGTPAVTTPVSALPNPAAVFCREKNYGYEIRRNPNGSEYGICILPGGIECEEWGYYRGDCPAVSTPATTPGAALANPSAVLCISKNYTYETRKNPDGSEYGVCIFPDGRECDAWAYFRSECNETPAR